MIGAAMLIPSLLQAGLGAAQYFGGRKLAKTPTPEYQIPQALKTMVGTQRQYAQGEMPGMSEMIQQQRQSTSNAYENMAKYGAIDPNVASGLAGQERGMVGNIGLQGSQYRINEKDKYMNVMGMMADEQNKKWDWETRLPAERDWAAGSALMGSGIQNMWGGVSSAGDMFAQRNMMQNLGYNVPNFWNNNNNTASNNGTITNPQMRYDLQTNPLTQQAQQSAFGMFQSQNPYFLPIQ